MFLYHERVGEEESEGEEAGAGWVDEGAPLASFSHCHHDVADDEDGAASDSGSIVASEPVPDGLAKAAGA